MELKSFEIEVLRSKVPVLLMITGKHCVPCKTMYPLFQQISRDYVKRMKCCIIDVEESPEIASFLAVASLPAFIIFVNGKARSQIIGSCSLAGLEILVEQYL